MEARADSQCHRAQELEAWTLMAKACVVYRLSGCAPHGVRRNHTEALALSNTLYQLYDL